MAIDHSTRRFLIASAPALLILAVAISAPVRAEEAPAPAPSVEPAPAAETPEATPAPVDPELMSRPTSAHPPATLKLVDSHWTAWDPPKPAEGDMVHLIETGDTLWDLSGKVLGSPWVWPQIWDRNRWIMDSHWIYPGDPLVLPGAAPMILAAAETAPPVDSAEGDMAGMPEDALPFGAGIEPEAPAPRVPREIPLADRHDLQCTSYIDTLFELPQAQVAIPDQETNLAFGEGEVVYINRGTEDGVSAGHEFDVIRAEHEVLPPAGGKPVGVLVSRRARLKVITSEARTATAEVIESCADIVTGDALVETWDGVAPVGLLHKAMHRYTTQPSGKAGGMIVASDENLMSVGQGDVVQVMAGSGDGYVPGARVYIFRPNEGGPEFARKLLGTGLVITARADTSAIKITESAREITMGDLVELQ